LWFIGGNISSALVNLTQIPLIVAPFLQGEYGFNKSWGALTEASKLYANGGFEQNRAFLPDRTAAPFKLEPGTNNKIYRDKDFALKGGKYQSKEDDKPKVAKEDGKYAELFARAEETAALRRGVGYEITELQKNLGDEVGSGLKLKSKIDAGMGYIFQNSERINREITLLAAYNLEMTKNGNKDKAIQKAIELTSKVHSHALPEVGPRMFQSGLGKVTFVFKRFAQAQVYLVAKLFNDVFGAKPKTEADKAARTVAAKQLIGVYVHTGLMAGVQGMPLYGLGTVLATLLFDDEDDPFEPHTYVNAAIGDLAYRGPLSALVGVDFSQRIGYRDLVFREDPAKLEKLGAINYMLQWLGGPAVSVATKGVDGVSLIANGEIQDGLEKLAPTAIANAIKTYRYETEGMRNKYGVPIIEGDPSAYESFMQILGFSNIELAEAYTRANALKGPERKLLKRKSALLLKYYLAKTVGDTNGMKEVQEDINTYNKKAPPSFRISRKTQQRSVSMRDKQAKDAQYGIKLGKKNRADLEERFGIPD